MVIHRGAAMAQLVIVVAVGRNGVIGDGKGLVWRMPSDLRHFRLATLGKPMLMGRRTFASIGKALPGRETIVLTHDLHFAADGVWVAHELEAALALAQQRAAAMGASEVILAGGGELYRQLLSRTDRIVLTEIDLEPSGDTRFPRLDPAVWRETSRQAHAAGPGDAAGFSFVTLERCDRSAATG